MKICNCYKQKLLNLINIKTDISILELLPNCEHKEKILTDFKNELMLFLISKNINLNKIFGGLNVNIFKK